MKTETAANREGGWAIDWQGGKWVALDLEGGSIGIWPAAYCGTPVFDQIHSFLLVVDPAHVSFPSLRLALDTAKGTASGPPPSTPVDAAQDPPER
jgi:hypothetical protein